MIFIMINLDLAKKSDAALCRLVCRGDANAFPELLARFMPDIQAAAVRNARVSAVDADDIVQEGMLALYRAAKGYQDERGAQFRTYAYTCISNAMTAFVKQQTRRFRRKGDLSLDEIGDAVLYKEALPGSSESIEDAYVRREALQYQQQQMLQLLSPLEEGVVRLYLQGYSYQVIAKMLGAASGKTIDNALQRARRKLRSESKRTSETI